LLGQQLSHIKGRETILNWVVCVSIPVAFLGGRGGGRGSDLLAVSMSMRISIEERESISFGIGVRVRAIAEGSKLLRGRRAMIGEF